MELKDFLEIAAANTENCLDQLLPPPAGTEAPLYEAMRYSVFAGGKRLRPALFLATLDAFADQLEAPPAAYLPFAAALEMIHTYSLIHDDLPAMDNDDLRRGRPTCHKAFGEAAAILAGDALLTHAFAAMLKLKRQVSAERLLDAMEEVAWAAGLRGMVAGQMADLALEGRRPSITQLQYMVQRKTGSLFTASILSAAQLAGANIQQMQILRSYSEQLGLVFQIADDILDIIGDPAKLGKPVGSDAKNHKATFVAVLGPQEATALAVETADQAVLTLAPFESRAELLRQFPHMMLRRDK